MKVFQTSICLFFLTLRDGNTALFKDTVREETEGGNITVGCSFFFSGNRRVFCRTDCTDRNILVETTGVRNQSGRYSIEYVERTRSNLLYVTITDLRKSDSGRYICWLDRSLALDSTETFEVRVKDASTASKPRPQPFSTSAPSTSAVTTTQSSTFSSRSSTPSSAPPETATKPQLQTASSLGSLLYLALILVLLVLVLSVTLLIFCRKRARKPKGPPAETDYANIQEATRMYEEIREDRPSRSVVDVSKVNSCVKLVKPDGGQNTDVYSLVTAAAFKNPAEGDSNKLTYSEVDFSKGPAASLSSSPAGEPNNVIYSVPRVDASSEDASPTLYSTVTFH